MLTCVPVALTLNLDAGAVHCPAMVCLQTMREDQQVQRALRAAIRNDHRKRPLAAADGAEVRHNSVQPREPQQAFHKASRLAKRHPEKHFHRQTGLDRSVAACLRPAPLAGGFGIPVHLGIEPDRQ